MQTVNGVLASYGTGRMGRLGCEGLSKSSQSMNSRSERHDRTVSEASRGSMETRALLHAYERYKDPSTGCDQYFQFYKRLVPLSNIHARPNSKKEVPETASDELAQIVEEKGSFDCLGCITVCDDSIVPPKGPGTRIRSHLLEPTFSIVDGHLRIDAAKLAKRKRYSLPDAVVVEVAVPDVDALPVETEKQLTQLAIRLNRSSEETPVPDHWDHKDLRRIDFVRRFLNATPDFKSMTLNCIGRGMIQKAASKAVEVHAIPGDDVGCVHLERYVRASLLFNSSPEAYDIYRREALKCKNGANHISIVTINSGLILRSEPAVRPLLIECVCVHGNTNKAQIKKQNQSTFIRNIISIYERLGKTAQRHGFSKDTFLNVNVSFQSGRKEPQRSTLREAIVAAATSKAMCTAGSKLKKVVTTLQTSLEVASRERKMQGYPPQGSTEVPMLSTIEKPFHKKGRSSRKDGTHKSQQLQGEETTSMSLVHTHREITRRSEESSADSPNERSGEEETELQQENSTFRGHRGRKRARSPERTSILRRKLLKRDGQRLCLEASNCEVGSRASYLHVHGRIDDVNTKDANGRNSVSCLEHNAIPPSFPNSLSSADQARRHSNRKDIERLRTELQDISSAARSTGIGALLELGKEEGPEPVRRCTQFVSFWSKHRAAVDEQGYTNIELPCPTFTAAIKNMLRSAGEACQKKPEESCDAGKTEGETIGRASQKICRVVNVAEQHRQGVTDGEWNIGPVRVGWARMMVESALVLISEWLGLNDSIDGKLGQKPFLSKAELLSMRLRDAGRPRLAFGLRRDDFHKEPWLPQRHPSYVLIVSGDIGFPMWVWERTHILLRSPDELLPLIAKSIKPRRVFVKPRSVLICRGDVVHAFENTDEISGQECSNPIAVMCHLFQFDMDRKKLDETEGWWTKYITTPGS